MATSSAFPTDNQYIKYKITVTENSQSVSGNYTNVTVSVRFYRTNTGYTTYGNGTVYCTIDGKRYTANVTTSQKITEAGIVLFSKTLNIDHDADGVKNLAVSAYIDHSRVTSSASSFTVSLTRIGRHSRIVNIGECVLGTAQSLTLEKYSSSYTQTIKYTCGDVTGTICEKSSDTTVTFTPPLSLAAQNPTGTSVFINLTVETFNGDESIGSYAVSYAYIIPESVAPTCEIVVSDVYGYGDKFGAFIKGKSALDITVKPTIAYGAEIVAYSITANDATYTAASAQTELIKVAGSLTITATVTDQRGRKGEASVTVEVLEHSAPSITAFKMVRCNAQGEASSTGEYAKAIFTNAVTPLNDRNTAVYTLEYKKMSENSYTSVTMESYAGSYSNTGAEFIIAEKFDTASAYDVVLTIQDAFSTASKATTCSSAFKLWSIFRKGVGFAFGKVAQLENTLEVAFKTKLTGGIIHPVPDAATDLNELRTPNTYRLPASGEYLNIPENDVEAILYVEGDGDVIRQRFFVPETTESGWANYERKSRDYERVFKDNAWGIWIDMHAHMRVEAYREILDNIVDMVYPTGSIYITVTPIDPGWIFGGTWEQIEDRFLLAAGSTYACGSEGGAESHKHVAPIGYESSSQYLGTVNVNGTTTSYNTVGGYNSVMRDTGGGTVPSGIAAYYTQTVEHMPPYLAVYVWKRVG